MARVAWTLTDYSAGVPLVFEFPINPNTFTPPGRSASISQEQSTAGQAVIFQGRDAIARGTMAGLVNTQSFYEELEQWGDKWYVLELTDDQGSTWEILITNISWTRVKRATNHWRYDYSIEFLEVG